MHVNTVAEWSTPTYTHLPTWAISIDMRICQNFRKNNSIYDMYNILLYPFRT